MNISLRQSISHQIRKYPYLRYILKTAKRKLGEKKYGDLYYRNTLQELNDINIALIPQKLKRPQGSLIEITNACNLNCLMCNTKLSTRPASLMLPEVFERIIKQLTEKGVEIAIVIGGGNIFRGLAGASKGMDRVQGDHMGMLATVINGLALQGALEDEKIPTRLQSAIKINEVAEPFIRRRALRHLEKGRVVIFGGGTGNPYFTTDSAAVLRAIEIKADVILKGTRVDGIYSSDPEKDSKATKFDFISFDDVLKKGLKVMDTTAFTLSQENELPIVVFDMNTRGNLLKVVSGENIGTKVNM